MATGILHIYGIPQYHVEIRIGAQRSLNFWTLSSVSSTRHVYCERRRSAHLQGGSGTQPVHRTQAAPAATQLCHLNSHRGWRTGTGFPNGSCSGSLRGQPWGERELDSNRRKRSTVQHNFQWHSVGGGKCQETIKTAPLCQRGHFILRRSWTTSPGN